MEEEMEEAIVEDAHVHNVVSLLGEDEFTNELTDEAVKFVTTSASPEDHKDLTVMHAVAKYRVPDDGGYPPGLLKRYAQLVNAVVGEKLVSGGCLTPPMSMNLCSECMECGALYAAVRQYTIEEEHAACFAKHGGPPPLKRKAMLLWYPMSQHTRETLNAFLEDTVFIEEGIVPEKEW